ncbi:MAG: RNA polymerase sigma factor, partial [Gemmataceae bacterium]
MSSTSESLLERLRQPLAQEAWAKFMYLYTPLLFHWVRQMGMRRQDAADLVQDILAHLVEKLPEFHYDPNRSFRGWLRTVIVNKWRDCQRRSVLPASPDNPDVDELVDPDNVAAFWEEDYRRHLVGRALEIMQAEFEPNTWKACWEVVVDDRPAAAVAAEL